MVSRSSCIPFDLRTIVSLRPFHNTLHALYLESGHGILFTHVNLSRILSCSFGTTITMSTFLLSRINHKFQERAGLPHNTRAVLSGNGFTHSTAHRPASHHG